MQADAAVKLQIHEKRFEYERLNFKKPKYLILDRYAYGKLLTEVQHYELYLGGVSEITHFHGLKITILHGNYSRTDGDTPRFYIEVAA